MKSSTTANSRKDLLELAKIGVTSAQDYFHHFEHCHIFTTEEVRAFNHYRYGKWNMEDDTFVRVTPKAGSARVKIRMGLDPYVEEWAVINYIRPIGDDFVIAGLTIDSGPSAGFLTEWVLKSDPIEGFIPMFCSLYEEPRKEVQSE